MPVFSDDEPLHLAAELGDVRRVQELLESGLSPDPRTSEKVTPLMVAAKRGFDAIVALLIQHGANVDAKDKAFKEEDGRRSALMDAAHAGHTSTCRLLLEAGAEVDATSQWGNTALNFACEQNRVPVVQLLLQHGADPDGSPNGKDLTPLSLAAGFDNLPILRALLEAGADPNMKLGKSPLMWAAKVESVRELLRFGADINFRDWDGRTAIYHAIPTGKTAVIECLLEGGADVNLASNFGEVPLMQLKLSPRLEVAKLLVQAGANVNHLVDPITSLLDYVEHGYHDYIPEEAQERSEILNFLRNRGAKTAEELKAGN